MIATVLVLLLSMIAKEGQKEILSMAVDVLKEEEEDSLGLAGRGDRPAQEETTLTPSFLISDVLGQQYWGGKPLRFTISLKYTQGSFIYHVILFWSFLDATPLSSTISFKDRKGKINNAKFYGHYC